MNAASPSAPPTRPVRVVSADDAVKHHGFTAYLQHLRWLAQHAALIRSQSQTQLKLTVSRSRLYYLWWMLDPILDTACYAVLFMLIRAGASSEGDGVPMVAFLLAGIVPWRFNGACWGAAGNIWVAHKALIEQVRFPHLVLLLARFLTEAWLYAIALLVLAGACVVFGVMPKASWLFLPVWIVVHALMVLAFMPVFAIASAFSQDLLKLLPYLLRLVFFFSPILYGMELVPDRFTPLFYMNPMTMLIETYRDVLLLGQMPDMVAVGWYVLAMLAVLGVTSMLFVWLGPAITRNVSRTY